MRTGPTSFPLRMNFARMTLMIMMWGMMQTLDATMIVKTSFCVCLFPFLFLFSLNGHSAIRSSGYPDACSLTNGTAKNPLCGVLLMPRFPSWYDRFNLNEIFHSNTNATCAQHVVPRGLRDRHIHTSSFFNFLRPLILPAPLSDVEVADALGLRSHAYTPPPFPMLVVAAATGK